MSRISAESFLSLITQSGLVESDRLKREVDDLEDQGCNVGEASALADSLIERALLTEWQAEKLLKGKHKGFTLGKYRLRRLLGKGGMSSVYLAEHILMRRQCAIKVLPIKRVEDTSYLARFHREARAVASLDHPNIVRAYDIDQESEGDKDIHFLVMEYVDGESLHEFVKDKGPLPLDDTAEFFRQAALGLENAHKNGLIHRDVKPGNLLIDKSGVVKVLDLGLARFSEVSDDNPLTLAHDEKVLGTADYLAPEQALDSHTADHRADIYGLGCTAYFALTGYPPFREGTLTQRLMFHQTKEPPAISEARPEVGETKRGIELVKIISRMMAKKPDERFQTMSEVSTAMARWLKIYATPQWRAAHPDAFLKSDAETAGGAIPVARAVAVPVAKAVSPEAAAPATTITSGSDTLLQSSAPPAAKPPQAVPQPPAAAQPVVPTAKPVVVDPPSPEPAAADNNDVDPGFGAFLAGFDGGAEPASPAFTEPDPEPPSAFTPPDETHPEPAKAKPVAPPTQPESQPETVSTYEPPATPAAIPVAAPVVSETPEPAEPESVEPEQVEPLSVEPAGDDLEAWDADEPTEEPLADFDPSILPAPIEQSDEYPSLLGGTPTGPNVPRLDDPGDATQSAMEQTSTFVPGTFTPAEPASDATLLNPVGNSSDANHDLAPQAFPTAPPVTGMAPVGPPPAETPLFPGVAEPAADQPMFSVQESSAAPAQPAFLTDAPTFGASPPATAPGQYASPGQYSTRTPEAKKKPPIAVIAGAAVALVVAMGAYFAFTGGDDAKPKSKKTAGTSKASSKNESSTASSAKPSVTAASSGKMLGQLIKVGPGGDFSTIGAALDYLRKNKSRYDTGSRRTSCKVEVNGGETFSEAIVVDNSKKAYPPGIQILSSGVGRAKLAPSGSSPAIRLVGIENWLIQGFDVDASGKEVAVEMSGYLNRTSLKDLKVSGFSKVGVSMQGAVGFSNDEIVLEKIDLRGNGRTTAGIHFTSGDNGTGRIKVLNCRLFGPQETGLLFETDVTYIELRENIIADAGVGISFSGGPLTLKDVQVLNTTFYKCSRGGMVISQMPVAGGGLGGSTGLAIHRNLFAELNGPELLIEKDFDDKKFDQVFSAAGGGVEQNWSDRQQPADISAGQREIVHRENQRVSTVAFSTTDDNSPDFLTLKTGTPYAQVGGAKLNTKPYIGARPVK